MQDDLLYKDYNPDPMMSKVGRLPKQTHEIWYEYVGRTIEFWG